MDGLSLNNKDVGRRKEGISIRTDAIRQDFKLLPGCSWVIVGCADCH